MQDLNKIRVTWQLAVVVCALAVLPIAGVGLVSVIVEPDQSGAHGVKIVCGSLVILTLLSYFAGISAGLYLAWPRYYMPFFLICLLLAGCGAGWALGRLTSTLGWRVATSHLRIPLTPAHGGEGQGEGALPRA